MTHSACSPWLVTEVINLKLSIRSDGSLFQPSFHDLFLRIPLSWTWRQSMTSAVTTNSPSDLILKGNNDLRSIYNALVHHMHVRLCRKAPCEDSDLDIWLHAVVQERAPVLKPSTHINQAERKMHHFVLPGLFKSSWRKGNVAPWRITIFVLAMIWRVWKLT